MWPLQKVPQEICTHQAFCDLVEFYRSSRWGWGGRFQQHGALWTAQLPHSLFSLHSVLEPTAPPSQEQNQLFFVAFAPYLAFIYCSWGMIWGNMPSKLQSFLICSLCNYIYCSPKRISVIRTFLHLILSSPNKNGRSLSQTFWGRWGEDKAKGFLMAPKPSLPHGPTLPVSFVRFVLMPWALPSSSAQWLGLGLSGYVWSYLLFFLPSPKFHAITSRAWTPLHVFDRTILPSPFVAWEYSLHLLLYPKQLSHLSVAQCPECRL